MDKVKHGKNILNKKKIMRFKNKKENKDNKIFQILF